MDQNNNESPGFKRLKYMGYCLSQSPPGEVSLEDLVNFAKFRLCEWRGYLMEDPIWEKYVDEQILIEYYATRFEKDKEFREAFEKTLGVNGYEDALDWMDKEIAKNAIEIGKLKPVKKPDEEEEFEYSPPVVGDGE